MPYVDAMGIEEVTRVTKEFIEELQSYKQSLPPSAKRMAETINGLNNSARTAGYALDELEAINREVTDDPSVAREHSAEHKQAIDDAYSEYDDATQEVSMHLSDAESNIEDGREQLDKVNHTLQSVDAYKETIRGALRANQEDEEDEDYQELAAQFRILKREEEEVQDTRNDFDSTLENLKNESGRIASADFNEAYNSYEDTKRRLESFSSNPLDKHMRSKRGKERGPKMPKERVPSQNQLDSMWW